MSFKRYVRFCRKIYLSIGRVPIRLKREVTGHIANRLASALWREVVNIVSEGIADVDVVDAALIHGPGLRWAVTGAHMTYHLGGGSGGMSDYLQHLGLSQELLWADQGTPNLSPEVCAILIAGVDTQAQGKTVAELEQIRDDGLLRILTARKLKS